MPSVLADRVQLQQVVLTLVVNGVSDRGTGLTPDEMDRVFQPFYTTKPNDMGMGLATSRSIIEAQEGRLWAERKPDHGATFSFRLPAAPGGAS